MIWDRSWPLGASTSTCTPDWEIWFLSSITSYLTEKEPEHSGCVTFDSCCRMVACDDWFRSTVDSHSHGSSSGSWAPPSRLQSHSRCSSWSCWCHLWLSSAHRCQPPQTGGLPAHCQTWRNARTQTLLQTQSAVVHIVPWNIKLFNVMTEDWQKCYKIQNCCCWHPVLSDDLDIWPHALKKLYRQSLELLT